MQVINDPYATNSSGWAHAIGGGLEQLAGIAMQEMTQRQERKKRSEAFRKSGLPPAWADLPDSAIRELLKGQRVAQESQEFARMFGQGEQGGQFQPQEQFQNPEQELFNSIQQQGPFTPNQGQANLERVLSSLGGVPGMQQSAPQQQMQEQQLQRQPQQRQLDFDRILANPNLKPDQRLRIEAMKLQKEAAEEKATGSKFKETKEYRKQIIDSARSARDRLHDLERMEELEQTGKLDTPGYMELLGRSGFDISTLKNPESQEFEKLSAGFMRDAKSMFGARISNYELEQFLKAIPSMSQSPEGRKRVIANLKRVTRASVEHANAMKSVMAKNKGVPPYDLMEKVDDIVEKKMDKLAEQFKKDLKKPVPAGQNRIITALQALAGSALGAPGKIIGKVGNIGSALGGLPIE
jgi:hypothetical protein